MKDKDDSANVCARKPPRVEIDFTRDNTLPGLNATDLALLGKADKPVRLKKGIIDRNERQHPDVNREEFERMLREALYSPDSIIPEKNPSKVNYYHFVKYQERDHSIVLIELSEGKDNYEVVHVQKMNTRNIEKLKIKNSG